MAQRNKQRPYYGQNVAHVTDQKLKALLELNPYDYKKEDEEYLRQVRRSLAKRANQRMVRLGRAVSPITGELYSSYGAEVLAQEYLSKQGRTRYTESIKVGDYKQVKQDIYSLQTFLASESSLVGTADPEGYGQRSIEQRRINTFSSGNWGSGDNISVTFAKNKNFYNFLNSRSFKTLSDLFDSETILELYQTARVSNKLDNKKVVKKFNEAVRAFESAEVHADIRNLRELLGVNPLV